MEDRIAHYRIVSELGRGGMGIVYKAYEESLNRHVALKVLGGHLADDDSFVARFVREAQSAAGLSHPNIVQIYAIGEDQGRRYFAMEYVPGSNLRELISRRGRLPIAEAEGIVLQAAAGLQAAHERGVIHRDIKPANLMIDERGLVKIADFGLALPMQGEVRLTATGRMLGSPGYLSPEQCRGETVDHRTDIYSLGVSLFEALTGRIPFEADSPLAMIRKIADVEPPDVRELNPDVDDSARAILARMMAKDPDQRYPGCAELVGDLERDLARRRTGIVEVPQGSPAAAESSTRGPSGPRELDTEPTVIVQTGAASEPVEGRVRVPRITGADEAPGGKAGRRTLLWIAAAVVAVAALLAVAGAIVVAKTGVIGRVAALRAARSATREAAPSTRSTPIGEESGAAGIAVGSGGVGAGDPGAVATDEAPPRSTPPLQVPTSPPRTDERAQAGSPLDTPGTAAPEVSPEPPPPATGVVVAAVGETLLAGQAEAYLEEALGRAGAELVDEHSLPELSGVFADGSVPERGAVRDALRGHARYLVLVRADYLGDRQLYYMGRPDVVYQARLSVTAVDLAEGRRIGPPLSEQLEYTALTVERVTNEALRGWLRGLRPLIQ